MKPVIRQLNVIALIVSISISTLADHRDPNDPGPQLVRPLAAYSFFGRTENVSGASNESGHTGLAYAGEGLVQIPTVGQQIPATACAEYRFSFAVAGSLQLSYRHTSRVIAGDSCSPQFCGTSPGMLVFTRRGNSAWNQALFPEPQNEVFTEHALPIRGAFDSVLICRGGGGLARNNIELQRVLGAQTHIDPYLKSNIRTQVLLVLSRANHYYQVVSTYDHQAALLASSFISAADQFYRFLGIENDRLTIRREYYLQRRQFYYARRAYFDHGLKTIFEIRIAWEELERQFHELEQFGLQLG